MSDDKSYSLCELVVSNILSSAVQERLVTLKLPSFLINKYTYSLEANSAFI